MIDTDLLSPTVVNVGVLLIVIGVVGAFLLEGRFSLVAGLVTGIGATAVLQSPRRDSTRSFGAGLVCFFWVMMLLADFSAEVMIGLGVAGIWFLGEANFDATVELVFDGTVGAKANKTEGEE